MSHERSVALAERAAELRASFDGSFARPRSTLRGDLQSLLAIRIGGEPYAVQLTDVGGVFVDKVVTPLPAPGLGLLGLAAVRSTIVGVYDLGVLLGRPPAERPRWLLLVRHPVLVGLACDGFDGQVRLPEAAISHEGGGSAIDGCLRGVARTPSGDLPIVSIAAIVERLRHGRGWDVPSGGKRQ